VRFFIIRALVLADVLYHLDHASQDDVINRLPLTRITTWTPSPWKSIDAEAGDAVATLPAAGRRRGGPRPFASYCGSCLAALKFRTLRRRVSATPRAWTDHDGRLIRPDDLWSISNAIRSLRTRSAAPWRRWDRPAHFE
jgi:hypothetical protein